MEERQRERTSKPKSRQSLAHVPSKANTTTDISALRRAEEAKSKSFRSRGKSIGPGGLEALTETNPNAFKLPPAIKPRSILKPTVPLTPPKAIPSFDELRNKSTAKAKSPLKNGEDLLIDFSTPGSSRNAVPGANVPGTENLVDPFSPIARPTSNEDQDEKERKRQEQKKAALERQAARRKSLGNRRVSFAPEATLHTWSVMELAEDSTTSSAANSTRRQSSMTAAQSPKLPAGTPARPDVRLSTPEDQTSDEVSVETPESQRELHQRKRRRTSDVSQTSEDDSFSSPGDGVESSPIRVEDSIDSESDTDGDTAMSLDEVTQNTVRSSGSSETQTSLDERLRQAEGQAGTRRIGQSQDDSDEDDEAQDDDDQSMDLADGTVTHAFRQYARKQTSRQLTEQENANKENLPIAGDDDLTYPSLEHLSAEDETTGMTMDMTRAVGGIVPKKQPIPRNTRRQSHMSQNVSHEDDTSYGDETMDMTVAKGGILSNASLQQDEDEDSVDEEDMTMEMTRAVGGIRGPARNNATLSFTTDETESMEMTMAAGGILPPIEEQTEPQSVIDGDYTNAMEMTRAVGKILPRAPQTEEDGTEAMSMMDDQPTTAMEMTRAVGQILPPNLDEDEELTEIQCPIQGDATTAMDMTRAMGTILPSLRLRSDENLDVRTPRHLDPTSLPQAHVSRPVAEDHVLAPSASETGSPTLKPRLSGRKAAAPRQSTTPTTTPRINALALPKGGQRTPTKQKTPGPTKSTSPKRTPILTANVSLRSASPKKLFTKEIRQRDSPASKNPRTEPLSLFSRDEITGLQTPKVVLTASKSRDHLRRKSSGTPLVNKPTTSPKVSELLSRRQSIGELAPEFQLNVGPKKHIQFEDPREIEQEIDLQRAEEHRRESGRFVMEREADEQAEDNTTQNLKDMIQSMTPQKQSKPRLKGRKSLAVGSARGLLGKRPQELDFDEDEEDHTPKRLKTVSREASPVKKVHLPKPPTAEQTTGRLSRLEQLALSGVSAGTFTPTTEQAAQQTVKTPEHTGHFRDPVSSAKPTSFEERLDNVVGATDVTTVNPAGSKEDADEKISLQDFLNMTNVHFIELSTTKRRHTLATTDTDGPEAEDGTSQATFMAAATTLPLLDLYQHATRELKSYISSGRKIVRQIEAETMAEQPPIFKQYVEARPDVKAAMDNQFRIGKTNARLQSKEGWYSWRTQLVDGLHTGLEGIRTDLEVDHDTLSEQQQALSALVPEVQARKALLEQQAFELRRRAEEYNSVDHEALQARRQELSLIDAENEKRAARVAELKQQLHDAQEQIASAQEMRHEMTAQITEAVRSQEEQRRWPAKEVLKSKGIVDELEAKSGWRLLSAQPMDDGDVQLTLQYQKQLQLSFNAAALAARTECSSGSAGIPQVIYQPDEEESVPKTPSAAKQLILEAANDQIAAMIADASQTITGKTLLSLVSHAWAIAKQLEDEIQQLETRGIVRTAIEEGKFVAKLMLMLPHRSRVDITFLTTVHADEFELGLTTSVTAAAVYGDSLSFMDASKSRKVENALTKEIEARTFGEASWLHAVRGFEDWLQHQSAPKPSTASIPTPAPVQQELGSDTAPTRARTTSPVRSMTPHKPPARSPLAPKTTNSKVKKLPVPKKVLESLLPQPTNFRESQRDKENLSQVATKVVAAVSNHEEMSYDEAFGLKNGVKPAIAPEAQEAMMHTPVKRRAGALRRSPI